MPNHTPDLSLLPLLDRALDEEIGLWVGSKQAKDLRTNLYTLRSEVKNPRYDELRFFLPAGNEKVFIVKKSVEIEG